MSYLTFLINAPMASWGSSSQGVASRYTNCYPTKSAIHGIICASLGIDREDKDQRCKALKFVKNLTIFCFKKGNLMRDFRVFKVTSLDSTHTASRILHKNINNCNKTGVHSRKQYLEKLQEGNKPLSSMISEVFYYTEQKHIVILNIKDLTDNEIKTLERGLNTPIFTPFFGRKTCIPGTPLSPAIHHDKDAVYQYIKDHNKKDNKNIYYDLYADLGSEFEENVSNLSLHREDIIDADMPCADFGYYAERNIVLIRDIPLYLNHKEN